MEALAKFFEFVKLPIKYLVGAFVVSAIFLFAPDAFLSRLGALRYREESKVYFGLLLAILAVAIIAAIVGAAIERSHDLFVMRARKKRIQFLSTEEK